MSNSNGAQISGFGAVTPAITNSGAVRAVGGTLTLTHGVTGSGGTLQSDAGATLALSATSSTGVIFNNGNLNLGTFNVTVATDYTNAGFGSGNGFNARANVSGTGQILAAGNTAQAVTGGVTGGGTAAPALSFGAVHVGDVVTRHFQIANTGATGPALRGALQTAVNGGNITDARLTGSGTVAGNFGIIAGGSSGVLDVSFTPTSVGALSIKRLPS